MNDYVLYGRGDVRAILPTLRTELFDTEEYLVLFQWMRQYNADPRHTRKIRFYGIDMQSTPLAVNGVLEYLTRAAPTERARVEAWLAPFSNRDAFRRYRHAARPVQDAAKRDVERVLQLFEHNRAALIAASTEDDWTLAQHLAWVIAQAAAEFSPPNDTSSDEVRDTAMAENVAWVLAREGPTARVVLSAHNGHIARAAYQGIPRMGQHLARLLGDRYYAIGMSFLQGAFGAYDGKPDSISQGIVSFSVPPPQPYFFETTLVKALDRPFFLDLRNLPSSPEARRWMAIPRPMRTFGAIYSGTDGVYPLAVWHDQFDGLFEVPDTTAARLLAGKSR